jgi:hypothetical protein
MHSDLSIPDALPAHYLIPWSLHSACGVSPFGTRQGPNISIHRARDEISHSLPPPLVTQILMTVHAIRDRIYHDKLHYALPDLSESRVMTPKLPPMRNLELKILLIDLLVKRKDVCCCDGDGAGDYPAFRFGKSLAG